MALESPLSGDSGFFRWSGLVCYGQCESGVGPRVGASPCCNGNGVNGSRLRLPFSPSQVIENLRHERYESDLAPGRERFVAHESFLKIYYTFRDLLPASLRRHLQRAYFSDWRTRPFPAWPVDFTVDLLHEKLLVMSMEAAGIDRVPFIWFWPDGAPACLMMTHDVETSAGRDFTSKLMDIDDAYGIVASFQVIPEKRYEVTGEYVFEIKRRGFEFNVHDLNHDGRLYHERAEFLRRAAAINSYVRKYEANGFRAGSMHRNLEWYDAFDFSYDMSVPNVAHLEPKRGGCCTVMPYFVGKILELPLTATQDYSLFHVLNDYSIDLWKRQMDMIQERHGLMSFIAHPDYLIDHRARVVYESLLDHLRQRIARDRIWAALPGEINRWWRARSQMQLVDSRGDWEIVGPQKEHARIAYAILDGDRIRYELAPMLTATA